MARHELLTASGGRWLRLLDRLEHDVYHLPQWSAIEAAREPGAEAAAFSYTSGDEVFLLPLLRRPIPGTKLFDSVSPYGYPGPLVSGGADAGFVAAACRALTEELATANVVTAFVRLHPLLGPRAADLDGGRLVRHGDTVAVDLGLSDEEVWARVRSGHRSEIRRARREGLAVQHDPVWREMDAFLEIYHETMERVGADDAYFFPRRHFERLRDELGGVMHLFVVRLGDEIVAASLISRVGTVAQYHLAGTRSEFLRLQPGKLLLDEAGRWARAAGARWFHLGGGVGGREDSLFNFKSGFSRDRCAFHTWRLPVLPDAYATLCRQHGAADAGDLDGFFPAYRA